MPSLRGKSNEQAWREHYSEVLARRAQLRSNLGRCPYGGRGAEVSGQVTTSSILPRSVDGVSMPPYAYDWQRRAACPCDQMVQLSATASLCIRPPAPPRA